MIATLNSKLLPGNLFVIFTYTRSLFIILIFLAAIPLFGQDAADCFYKTRRQHYAELDRLNLAGKFYPDPDSLNKHLDYHDLDSLAALGMRTLDRVTGCKYPDTTFISTAGQPVSIDHSNTKYLVLHFNDVYCDRCLKQLDELEQLKSEAGQNLLIMAVFAQDKGQLKFLEDRYGKAFVFVPDARKYIQSYNLGQGYPMTYLLDNNKLILRALKGAGQKDWLYNELAKQLQ